VNRRRQSARQNLCTAYADSISDCRSPTGPMCDRPKVASRREDILRPVVRIFESELLSGARRAVENRDVETGGCFYGAYTGDNRITVLLATPPGPNAHHSHGRFCQDIDFVRHADELIVTQFGQRNAGRYHSHTGADSRLPSRHDNDTAVSTIKKNGFPVYLEFLFVPSAHEPGHIKLYPFAYVGSSEPKLVQCKVRILSGCSPVRERLFGSAVFPDAGSYAWWFPIEKVTIVGQDRHGHTIPQKLLAQVLALPSHVRHEAELMQKGDVVLVILPVGGQHTAVFGYRLPEASQPIAVSIRAATGEGIDLTHRCSVCQGLCSISDIYARLENMICTQGTPTLDAWDHSTALLDTHDPCGNFVSHPPRFSQVTGNEAPPSLYGLSVGGCGKEISQVSPEEPPPQTTLPMERE